MNRGKPYQQLVAEVAKAFDPGAEVTEGKWIAGPDGRLDMDVSIRGQIDGKTFLIVIECKDFNRKSTGKVGREYVDALDSKRQDLRASFAMICSNSGFTADALHKAERKGIGMISVLRKGDNRAKAEIFEEIFLRLIRFGEWRFTYHSIGDISWPPVRLHRFRFNGCSLDTWLFHRALQVAVHNPTNTQRVQKSFRFSTPLTFSCDENPVVLSGAEVSFVYTTEWRCQTVRLDASLALFDYLRGRVVLGPGKSQYSIEGVNWEAATVCESPEASAALSTVPFPNSGSGAIIFFEGHVVPPEEAPEIPELEPHVVPSDLDCSVLSEG